MDRSLAKDMQGGDQTERHGKEHAERADQPVGGDRSQADGSVISQLHGACQAKDVSTDGCR